MTKPIRVLIGDDDACSLEEIADLMESTGLEVVQVHTAADLYSAALSDEPDIIVSDFDYGFGRSDAFPDGVAIGIALREADVTVPFIIFSGLHRRSAAEAGFVQCLKDDIEGLLYKINDLVRGTDEA